MDTVESFADWLQNELNDRGWSRSEAARRGEFSASMLDKVINEYTPPGYNTCAGIARAFNMRLEDVLRKAGLLPPEPKESTTRRELMYLFEQLSDDDRERIVQIARTFADARAEQPGGQLGNQEPATT